MIFPIMHELEIDKDNADEFADIIGQPLVDAIKQDHPTGEYNVFEVDSVDVENGIMRLKQVESEEINEQLKTTM